MDDTRLPDHTLPDHDKELEAGQQVGEYVIEGKLGAGGFGTVFRATHPVIGKQVAIKVLNRQFSVQREMVSRFIAEARAVNQIRHRNIIDIFAFSTLPDGRHYYVMELLDGVTLGDHLEDVGAMSLREALPILRAVGRALDAAHAKGIAHRDLKPENIFLAHDPDGGFFPKLLDFGIAKLLVGEEASGAHHKTRTGAPIGTPLYMSPEQCRGRDIDHRTDIYSFGIVAFRMLTGKLPFDADDYMTILMQQMADTAPPPSSLVAELPLEVDRVIAGMMEKEPSARPGSLAKAVEALERAAGEAGGHAGRGTGDQTPPIGGLAAAATVVATATAVAATPRPEERSGAGLGHAATMQSGAMPVSVSAPAVAAAERNTTPDVAAPRPAPQRRKRMAIAAAGLGAAAALAFVGLRRDPDRSTKSRSAERAAQLDRLTAAVTALEAAAAAPAAAPAAAAAPQPPQTPSAVAAAPPTAPPAAPPPTPTPTPAAPADTVRLTFTGLPDGAIVYGEGHRALGLAKQGILVPRDGARLALTFEVDGRVIARKRVLAKADAEIAVTLARPPRRPDRGKPTGAPAGATDPNSTERPPGL